MKILIVGPSWVGDAVMAQSLYKIIKDSNPQSKIDVLSPEWSLGILNRMDELDDLICSPFDHGDLRIKDRVRFGYSLRDRSYDQAIVLTNSLKSSFIPFTANIPKRTGWLGEMRYGFINDIRKVNKNKHKLMVEKFSCLSINPLVENNYEIPWPSLRVDLINLSKLLKKYSFEQSHESIAICPGAEFGPSKRWPANYYAEVIRHYLSKNWQVFILGSKNDLPVAKVIEDQVPSENKALLFNFTGQTSIEDAVDILSTCDLVLTNDSGLMHVAAAVNVKLLALYGPTSPKFTPPLSKKAKVIQKIEGYEKTREGELEEGYHYGLSMIKPEEVLDSLSLLLKDIG
jgi:heptosyltransferase-2